MTDPIADMLTRIRNAQKVKLSDVLIPYSKNKLSLAKILKDEGYINSVEEISKFPKKIKLLLKYDSKGRGVIQEAKRISKPGQRVYAGKDKLPKVLNGLGVAIISTSKGLLPDYRAKKEKLGGEIVCYIY